MYKFKIAIIFIALILCIGCTKKDAVFIGTWSNVTESGGNLQLVITKDVDKLLVKTLLADSGKLIWMYGAKVEDGYLITEGDTLFSKMSYSESEDMLMPITNGEYTPGFHRIK